MAWCFHPSVISNTPPSTNPQRKYSIAVFRNHRVSLGKPLYPSPLDVHYWYVIVLRNSTSCKDGETTSPPSRHWHDGRLTCYEHRTWCQAHDFFCHAAQEDVLESGPTVCTHDNEIHPLCLGRLENFVKRHPVHHDNVPF